MKTIREASITNESRITTRVEVGGTTEESYAYICIEINDVKSAWAYYRIADLQPFLVAAAGILKQPQMFQVKPEGSVHPIEAT